VATISATPDATFSPAARPAPTDSVGFARRPVDASQDEADLRLVIEEGRSAGAYIYKTINRVTGEVVAQFPREEVLQMQDDADYAAGSMVNAKV
jgi:flagellar protein FlaG